MTNALFERTPAPAPEPGLVAAIHALPPCDFCPAEAHFDFATKMGPWAYGCFEHYFALRAADSLGLGKGQRLVERT